jgi:predicted PurR-regulated permease PerM
MQLALSVLVAFFLFRDGEAAAARLQHATLRVAGPDARYLLDVAGQTVNSVVYGILGTALAQGVLAGIGFWVAHVPGASLLGLATFFLSVVPVGPPLIWGSAAVWLYYQGELGWAIFLALWGLLVVSMVDNFLKPFIISRGSSLPFILVFLGVLGGVVAFGFIGVFLGPTLLAVGYRILDEWAGEKVENL